MYIFGGVNPNQTFNDMWAYDLGTLPFFYSLFFYHNQLFILLFNLEENTWTPIEYADNDNSAYPRSSHLAVVISDEMWVFGGNYQSMFTLSDIWAYNFSMFFNIYKKRRCFNLYYDREFIMEINYLE